MTDRNPTQPTPKGLERSAVQGALRSLASGTILILGSVIGAYGQEASHETDVRAAWDVVVPSGWRASSHYAPAVRIGNSIHVSGITASQPDGPNDIESQGRRVFELLQEVLVAAGSDLDHVYSITTYHIDIQQTIRGFMAAKNEFMGHRDPYFAWTAVGVERLYVPTALVEVSVIALVRDGD